MGPPGDSLPRLQVPDGDEAIVGGGEHEAWVGWMRLQNVH